MASTRVTSINMGSGGKQVRGVMAQLLLNQDIIRKLGNFYTEKILGVTEPDAFILEMKKPRIKVIK